MNILFTSVGRRTYLVNYFKEVLKENGKIHVMNSNENSPAFFAADKAVVSPLIYDDNYINFLLEYCVQEKIDAIIPLFDIDLPVLSHNKEKFTNIGVALVVSPAEFIDKCNDKWHMYKFLRENDINTPLTYKSLNEAEKALERGDMSYPIIVKPRWGMGSIGVYEVCEKKELEVLYDKAKREILRTYLKYESNRNIEESVLIQEKIFGSELGVDIINDLNGKYRATVVKQKLSMRSGKTDCAVTICNQNVSLMGEKIAGISKHIGNLDVDVIADGGIYNVIDMNARFGGGYPFGHLAGVNLPLAIVSWLKGEDVAEEVLTPKIGVKGQKNIEIVTLR